MRFLQSSDSLLDAKVYLFALDCLEISKEVASGFLHGSSLLGRQVLNVPWRLEGMDHLFLGELVHLDRLQLLRFKELRELRVGHLPLDVDRLCEVDSKRDGPFDRESF